MTRKRSSPMGLEMYLPVLLAFVMLPLLTQAAPLQDYTEIQQYTEGCYYNYNHYNEGDRIMTNEPCLNCTCHNKMLMCYLRVCPFTKPIGHDCIVEKREDQCCPIITCPEVPVDVAHAAPEPGTELSFPEKFGCSIDGKFYLEGAQVPSNPNKPCELCYCIKNRTSCLMQECTLHIEGCTPIYNKGSCCPVRYNCDHENDVLELEDHSSTTEAATTTTTERPTTGFIISSTMTPTVSTDCIHNKELYADGARIPGETACENCYCMRGDIVCAVQDCHMPMLKDQGKLCHPLPAAEGECCPSNYVCEDDTTQTIESTTLPYSVAHEESEINTVAPVKDLHSGIPEEDLQLQTHIDEEDTTTKAAPAEDKQEEKESDTAAVRKPVDNKNQHDYEQESTIKYSEQPEATTISISDIRTDENPESITVSPALSDKQNESATDLSSAYDEQTVSTTEKLGYSAQEDEKEFVTRVITGTSELPQISSDSSDSNEQYTTTSSAEQKPEVEEFFTTASVADLEYQTTTEITPTAVKVSEESTESSEEIKAITNEESVTQVPGVSEKIDVSEAYDKESEPHESIESLQETSEMENNPTESATKSRLDIESTTQTVEEVQAETKVPFILGEQDKLVTDAPLITPATEGDQESTTSTTGVEQESAGTDENIDATTQIAEKIAPEEMDLSTEEPKIEQGPEDKEKEHQEDDTTLTSISADQTTEFLDKIQSVFTTESSIESDHAEMITKLSVGVDERLSTTLASTVAEDEGELFSTTPANVDSMPSKQETEVLEEESTVFDEKEKHDITTSVPIKSEEHSTISSADIKPMFDDELGSGDYNTEVSPKKTSEISQPSLTIETSTSQEQDENDEVYTTAQPIVPAKERPIEESTFNELLEESAESAESEEDSRLMDLTTAKSSESDATTSADEKTKDYAEQMEITTIKPVYATNFTKNVTEETEKTTEILTTKTPDEDNADITTTATSLDGELSNVHQEHVGEQEDKLFEETEDASTPIMAQEADRDEISNDLDKNVDTTEETAEIENISTQKSIEEDNEQPSTVQTVDTIPKGENDGQQISPQIDDHKGETPTAVTDSPMVIVEDITELPTLNPNAQTDIGTIANAETENDKKEPVASQEASTDIEGEYEGQTSTTTTVKTFVEPSRAEDIPHMQLPSVIPGEGNCLVGQKTFENNVTVPTSDECEVSCKCSSSVIVCERVKCDVPQNIEKCILDEFSTDKCCPKYICLPSKESDSAESVEEDEDEEVAYTTSPTKVSTKEGIVETTAKPISNAFTPAVSIPEIEMPVVFTEEPMSHVKDEDDEEAQPTKTPDYSIAEDKKDMLSEDQLSTTPAATIEEIIAPQPITPQQEKHEVITDEVTVKQPEKDLSVSQEQPKEKFEEHTTLAHEFVESTTVSTVHVPSDTKIENEIHSTTIAPTTHENKTIQPFEAEESADEKSEMKGQTAMPSLSPTTETKTTDESSEEYETSVTDSTFEKNKESEIHTEKVITTDTAEELHTIPAVESHDTDKPETQNILPVDIEASSEVSTDVSDSSKTEKEIESSATTPSTEVSTESKEKQPSTEDHNKTIFDSTTMTSVSKEHDTISDDVIATTEISLIDDSERETSTIKETSEEMEDNTSLSTSTIASVLEKEDKDLSAISDLYQESLEKMHEKDSEETVKPIQEKQDVEFTTPIANTSDGKSVEPVTTEEGILEHTVSTVTSEIGKETYGEPLSSTTYQPEIQTNIANTDDHTIASDEFVDNGQEKDIHLSSTASVDENLSAHTATYGSEDNEITTERQFFETKTETSTLAPSMEDITTPTSTIVASKIEKSDENKESAEGQTLGSSTSVSVEQQTEFEELTDTTGTTVKPTKVENATISFVEQVKADEEITMDHTEGPSFEEENLVTKHAVTSAETEPQNGDQSTNIPITSDKYTTETILPEEDMVPVTESEIISEPEHNEPHDLISIPSDITVPSTPTLSIKPSTDLLEETSGESIESEEEVGTEPALIHSTVEHITQSVEEEEKEASGEGSEDDNKMLETTEKQEKEFYTTTEQAHVSGTHEFSEVGIDKLLDLPTKVPTADNELVTYAPISSEDISEKITDENTFPNVNETPLDESTMDMQTEKHIVPSANEEELASGHESTEKPKETEDLSSVQSTTEPEFVTTQAPMDTEDIVTNTLPYNDEMEEVTVKHPKDESDLNLTKPEEIDYFTEQPKEQDFGYSTTKEPLKSDVNQSATDKYPTEVDDFSAVTVKPREDEEVFATSTRSPIAPTTIDLTAAPEEHKTSENVPAEGAEQDKEGLAIEDIEINTYRIPEEQDTFSTTKSPIESIDGSAAQPSEESEDNLDITKTPGYLEIEHTSVKLPVHDEITDSAVTHLPVRDTEEENDEVDEITDKITEAPMVLENEIITDIPSKNPQLHEESHVIITEIPVLSEIVTEKLPSIKEHGTEIADNDSEIEKDATLERTTYAPMVAHVSEDSLPTEETKQPAIDTTYEEELYEKTTAHVPTEIVGSVTEIPTRDIITEKTVEVTTGTYVALDDITEQHTELPSKGFEHENETDKPLSELPAKAEVSTVTLHEHLEDEKSYEKTTRFPLDSHVFTESLAGGVTEPPTKDVEISEEFTVSSVDAEIATDKLHEHVTELPAQSYEEDVEKEHMVVDKDKPHEEITELPEDAYGTSVKFPEYTTKLPTKYTQPEGQEEPIDKSPAYTTETPFTKIESEKPTEELPEVPSRYDESEKQTSETTTELPGAPQDVFMSGQSLEQTTENAYKMEEHFKDITTEAAEDISSVKLHASTTLHPLFQHHSTSASASIDSRIDDTSSHRTPLPEKNEEVFVPPTTTTVSTTTTEPITTTTPHYQPQPPVYGQQPQYGPTQYEDEYTDEDEGEVFGPGTCRYGGKLYVSAQQIPRDDPCDFCFCFRSDIICLQQSCPPPIAGCHEEPISGFCCPRYECPVSMATVLNITTSTTTTSTTLPPHFLHHSYGNNVQRNGCLINGRSYRVGEKIESTSGPCINCTCGGDGKMKCDPQACVPEPTMQQVMAVVAAGRKR